MNKVLCNSYIGHRQTRGASPSPSSAHAKRRASAPMAPGLASMQLTTKTISRESTCVIEEGNEQYVILFHLYVSFYNIANNQIYNVFI